MSNGDALWIFLAGLLAGVAVTLLSSRIPEVISGMRLIAFFSRTRDRDRAVRLWTLDEITRKYRRRGLNGGLPYR